jgi:nucleotide-binding universal stress UspA family protein
MTYRVVVGVDGSEHGNAALCWAAQDAKVHDGGIVAVFAWQMPFIGTPLAFDRDEMERRNITFLDVAVAAVVSAAEVPITKLVAQGEVSASLIEAAKIADLLVLGSGGRGGVAGLKLGSVSQNCLRHLACPVVVVKSPLRHLRR